MMQETAVNLHTKPNRAEDESVVEDTHSAQPVRLAEWLAACIFIFSFCAPQGGANRSATCSSVLTSPLKS